MKKGQSDRFIKSPEQAVNVAKLLDVFWKNLIYCDVNPDPEFTVK